MRAAKLLIALLGLGLKLSMASGLEILHSFDPVQSDGAAPEIPLVLSGNVLWGTTYDGGTNGYGTVFRVNTDGSGYAKVYDYSTSFRPWSDFLVIDGSFYGTELYGGTNFMGTVYRMNPDGSGFTNLHGFSTQGSNSFYYYTNWDGEAPWGVFKASSNILFGTTYGGGFFGGGTIFRMNLDGSQFTNLFNFDEISPDGQTIYSQHPSAKLALSDDAFYGVTYHGGDYSQGSVFKVNTDGSGYTNFYSFNGGDGMHPESALVFSGQRLYGTTTDGGGLFAQGTVFAINKDGSGFASLHTFTFSDGSTPRAGLTLSGNTLYGVTLFGPPIFEGTIFSLNTDGTGFTNLYFFSEFSDAARTNYDGANPQAGLIISGNTLYGTASAGGVNGHGTIFKLSLPLPQLSIETVAGAVILRWENPAYSLQISESISGGYQTISNLSPFTNSISGQSRFFRLAKE